MSRDGSKRSSKGGATTGGASERWHGVQSRRMAAVWDRIDSSAQALGDAIRARTREGAEKTSEENGEGQSSRPSASCFSQALERCAEGADLVFEIVDTVTRALAPAALLPLFKLPGDCARRAVVGGIRTLRRLVN